MLRSWYIKAGEKFAVTMSHSKYKASSSARNRPAQSALSEPPAWIPPEYIGFLFLSLLPIYRIQSIFREFRACTVCRTSPVLYIMEPAVANGYCRLAFYIDSKTIFKSKKILHIIYEALRELAAVRRC